jgi:hypothetical protein
MLDWKEITKYILNWIKRDAWIIFVCLLALAGCIYTLGSVESYQNQINSYWLNAWERSGCAAKQGGFVPAPVNITFNLLGVYNDSN